MAALEVLWSNQRGAEEAAELRHLFAPDIHLSIEPDKGKLAPYLPSTQVLVDGNPSDEALDSPRLAHVIAPMAGISPGLREQLLARPQLKLYNSHYSAPFVAQHALALVLACASRLLEADPPLRKGDWRALYDNDLMSLPLAGKTCLLLGYGAIGQGFAGLAKGFEMRFVVVKRTPLQDHSVGTSYPPEALTEAVAAADLIVVSLPHTPETDKILDTKVFAAMKPHAIVVNVGRAEVIDQYALYESLKQRRILAAGIDVWWRHPHDPTSRASTLPSKAPLHELPNIVVSPHRGNRMTGAESARIEDVAATLKAIVSGDERNRADAKRGY